MEFVSRSSMPRIAAKLVSSKMRSKASLEPREKAVFKGPNLSLESWVMKKLGFVSQIEYETEGTTF
jgi:hypothetical protein